MLKNTNHIELQQVIAIFQRGDFTSAYKRGMALLNKSPRDKVLLEVIGVSASKLGQLLVAERYLNKAIKLAPNRPSLHQALAETFQQANRLDDAMREFDRAGALEPDSVFPAAGKAAVLERRGDAEGAIKLLLPFVEKDKTGFAASVLATALQSLGRYDETIKLIEQYLPSPEIDHRVRMSMCRMIAKAYEKTDDYGSAFSALARSNELMARPFDRKAYELRIDDLIATFSEDNLARIPRATKSNERPVFIACMPRSGSTLVEQIVHSHPRCFGAGEITDIAEIVRALPASLQSIQVYPDCLGDWTRAHADQIQRGYLETLRQYSSSASRVSNKHLDNDLHLGLIALLFPGAKVLQTNRNPLDNCFSIFMAAMNTKVYPWSTDLTDIAFVMGQRQRLMNHWHAVLDLDIHEVSYESVVADPEPEIRGIIHHLDLDWDEACLSFHTSKRDVATLSYDQVRRPVYNSAVNRWKRYEEHLGPLIEAVSSWVD